MVEYFYSPIARRDLLRIWKYIARDDLDAADRVEREIEAAVAKLGQNPGIGDLRRDLTSRKVRFWAVYSYLIVYDPESSPLEVVRVLSGFRDIARMLK